jgi:hypothetical protein
MWIHVVASLLCSSPWALALPAGSPPRPLQEQLSPAYHVNFAPFAPQYEMAYHPQESITPRSVYYPNDGYYPSFQPEHSTQPHHHRWGEDVHQVYAHHSLSQDEAYALQNVEEHLMTDFSGLEVGPINSAESYMDFLREGNEQQGAHHQASTSGSVPIKPRKTEERYKYSKAVRAFGDRMAARRQDKYLNGRRREMQKYKYMKLLTDEQKRIIDEGKDVEQIEEIASSLLNRVSSDKPVSRSDPY